MQHFNASFKNRYQSCSISMRVLKTDIKATLIYRMADELE